MCMNPLADISRDQFMVRAARFLAPMVSSTPRRIYRMALSSRIPSTFQSLDEFPEEDTVVHQALSAAP